jgi:hypothetical protein
MSMLARLSARADLNQKFSSLDEVYRELGPTQATAIDRAAFRQFLQDLDARLLIQVGDIDEFPEYASGAAHIVLESSTVRPLQVTVLGKAFLAFVTEFEARESREETPS